MTSPSLFVWGVGALLLSFGIPLLSLPLQVAAFILFVLSELTCRHEIRYVQPVKERRYKAWEATLDHALEYQTGVAQAHATNRIDWKYRQKNLQLDLNRSIREKYLRLFTQGHQQPQIVEAKSSKPSVQNDPPQPEQQPVQQSQPEASNDTPLLKLETLRNASFVLIYGCPGGGKTSLAKRLAQLRAKEGDRIIVADPHGSRAAWGDWAIVGSGRNYEQLDDFLSEFDDAITKAYRLYSQGQEQFPLETLIAEEFTQWADNCKNAPKLVKSSCSDIRKIGKQLILVTHADTLTGLGNSQGMMAAINRAAIKIELEADVSNSGDYIATGYGWIQYPGKDRKRVRIPHD